MLHFKKATLKSFRDMYIIKLNFNFIIMIQIISKLQLAVISNFSHYHHF